MEESNEKLSGTVQYWLEVHRIGSLLFQNIKNGDNSLKSLTTSILESPLLYDIECLSKDEIINGVVSPFTSWLLEGFLKASIYHTFSHFKTFYIVSQSKLLTSCYGRSLFDFQNLATGYINFLEKIIHTKTFPSKFTFLLQKDYNLTNYNKILSSTEYVINSSSVQIDFIIIIVEVLKNLVDLITYHCPEIHPLLWKILIMLFSSNNQGINCLVLPLLCHMIQFSESNCIEDENVIKIIFKNIFKMIANPTVMDNPVYQQKISEIMSKIKEKYSVVKICNKDFVRNILKNEILNNKKCNTNKNFLINELSFLISEIWENENVLNFLEEFPDISFIDKINLSFNSICCELEDYIQSKNFFQECYFREKKDSNIVSLNAAEISINWKKILSFQNVLLVNVDSSTSKLRLESISFLVKFCWEIFLKFDMKFKLCKFKIDIIFFGDIFCDLIDKLLSDLHLISFQQDKALQLTIETIAGLLNLPESQNQSSEKYKQYFDFLVPPLASDKFLVPGFGNLPLNSKVPVLFLKCLQTIPIFKSEDSCMKIFSKCSSLGDYNKCLTMQAVKSVPFLLLCQNVSPSRLISEVFLPVALQEDKELLDVFIDTLPNFVCALSGFGFIKREKNYELSIYCKKCFSHDTVEELPNDLLSLKPHLIKLICQISLQDIFTKKKLLKILPRLAVHLSLANEEILKKFLPFLSDPDEEVRHLFSKIIENLLFDKMTGKMENRHSGDESKEENLNSENSNVFNLFFQTIEKLIYLSLNSRDYTFLQETLLEILVNVFRVCNTRVLGKGITLLLLFIGQPNVSLPTIILEITAAHETTPLLLYYSHRPEISYFLGNFLAVNHIQYKQHLRSLIVEVVSVFKGLTESRFASGSGSYIIPVLVLWSLRYDEAANMLEEWASLAEQSLPSLITKCFHFIFTYTFLNESTEVFEKCLVFVENITSLKFSELIVHCQKLIIYQLLFNHHKNPEKVLNALKKALGLSSDQGKQKVIENLESRFVGYLLFIVSKFVKEINADSEKVQAILSLTSVIELMGKKYVTPIARKVLATLQTTLSFNCEEYFSIQLNAWTVFVQNVNPEDLGPLLATIIITLIPFLKPLPVATARIFHFLIVKNEEAVKDFLPSLIFFPQHPLLTPVISKLQKYISFEGESLKDKLVREISIALHETVGVRIEGLKALKNTIKNYLSEIQTLIIGSDEPDPCIKVLLDGLFTCCSDCDKSISSLAASCLGSLGAIDPGLLPREPKPKNTLPLSVHDPEFAYLALTEICRGFQNARNSVDMDAFAIAIQEILKMYQISPTSENRIWYRFPQQIQNLMTPMLSSWFKVQAPQRDVWPEIVFGSQKINTHIGWASVWASKLIGYCKDDRSVFLFKACEPSLKRDTKVLLFFLQYILLQAVIKDATVHESVIKEIETVINYSPQNIGQDDFKIKARPIRLVDYCGYPNMRSTITESEAKNCAMTIFLLIDFLHSWLREYRSINCTANGDHLQKRDYVIVKDFLDKVDYLRLSILNYDIGEYPRAIMYLEDVILKTGNLSEHLPLLSKAYALYGDLDSVAGSSTFQKASPKIEDLLLSHQVSGQLEETRIIYEKLGKDGLLSPVHFQEMIQCYLNLGEPYTALNCINSLTKNQPDLMSLLSETMAESLISLGDYSQLDKFLKESKYPHQDDWFIQVGHLLLNVRKGEKENFLQGILNSRLKLANSLKQIGLLQSDYQPGYFCLVKLQILNEIERVFDVINSSSREINDVKLMVDEWNSMFNIVQSDHGSLESLLSLRRVLLNILKENLPKENENFFDVEIAKNWVKSAEIARKAGCFHQSYNYILNAEQCNIPLTFIEKAQLYWDKNDQDLCLFTLSRGIKEFFPNASEMKNWPAGERLEERKMCAEAKLLYAVYSEETSNCDHNTNMTNYQSAFEVCRQLEKTETFLGQCLDRVVQHIDNNEQEQRKICELKILMVHHFGKSLMYGCEYIYQTVPRMLSIWLDLGEKVDTEEKSQALLKINKIIQGFVDSLPAFVFMTALPQLISRLGHPNRKVFLILKNILGQLLLAFPQQCLWAVQAVAKSSVAERVQRYNEFIQDSALNSPELIKLIADFTNLCDKLNKLTNRVLSQETAFRGLKVSSIVKELPQLLSSEKFSSIIIPITRFCSISLPRNVMSSSHEPFPRQAVYITGIEEEVTVLQSLQRPRKISFRGSDGKLYDILCKPKDDLRRDGRLMEFNNIVNMYLRRDPESRLRRLHIRTYVVTPLGESGGLLEWVPNLIGLRQILIKLYKQFGKYVKTKEVKRNECLVRDSLEKKRTIFVEKLLVLHPPLFPEWFRLTFPDPSGWYIARESYVRTTAVMSMVGYILGLGDRHGENILFDSESGDTVHVDFNCLFNKGEKFDWKERVPFRLTHNMVAAMGPFGVEGTFRKSCEITLRVLRSQTKTLMSVLTPFAYDPFGSWGKNKEIVQNERDQKIGEAYGELSDIEQRLNGSLRVRQKQSSMYLSVEGQVRSLIIEATDIDNLCQMYFGWGAYL